MLGTANREIFPGEETGLELAIVDRNLKQGVYAEQWEHFPLSKVIKWIDRDLFPQNPQGNLFRGWRLEDVRIGAFLPPRTEMVPHLMEKFCQKVDELSRKIPMSSEDWYRFVAWTAWTQRNIHPKQDGNGRLIKAEMGLFLPGRRFYGHVNELWDYAGVAEAIDKIYRVADRLGIEPPEGLIEHYDHAETTSLDVSMERDLEGFFRYQEADRERDLASELIVDGIDRTLVDLGGFIPRGVSRLALDYMVQFLKGAPLRNPPKRRGIFGWTGWI